MADIENNSPKSFCYICEVCDKLFRHSEELKRHKTIHKSAEPENNLANFEEKPSENSTNDEGLTEVIPYDHSVVHLPILRSHVRGNNNIVKYKHTRDIEINYNFDNGTSKRVKMQSNYSYENSEMRLRNRSTEISYDEEMSDIDIDDPDNDPNWSGEEFQRIVTSPSGASNPSDDTIDLLQEGSPTSEALVSHDNEEIHDTELESEQKNPDDRYASRGDRNSEIQHSQLDCVVFSYPTNITGSTSTSLYDLVPKVKTTETFNHKFVEASYAKSIVSRLYVDPTSNLM